MRKLPHTKVTVRIRKHEFEKLWYLYLESYPVIKEGKTVRIREYLNRTITTVEWDKKHPAKKATNGAKNYKPKRDENGLIICKSKLDQEAVIYADNVRKFRQEEYDKAILYSAEEQRMLELTEKGEVNFLSYYDKITKTRNKNRSDSIRTNWLRVGKYLHKYAKNEYIPFKHITEQWCNGFKEFLINAPSLGKNCKTLSRNTSVTYFSIFKAAIKQAFIDGYFNVDMSAKLKGLQEQESQRRYLTIEELNKLNQTTCKYEVVKRAALFSALTGLRHVDIKLLKWGDILEDSKGYQLHFRQKKTNGIEYLPISEQAYHLCGKRLQAEDLVFQDLLDPSWINRPLKQWCQAAGISKHITFHCFRHTFATLQLDGGTDIFTVSKLLGHTNVKTTQIYTHITDKKKEKAKNIIKLQ